MGKKRRIKKNNQEKLVQARDRVDNPRITARVSDGVDLISSLHGEASIPLLLHKRKQQEQEHRLQLIRRNTTNNLDPNDFISRLPNNILHHIISLLPFEFAVRTAVLSTHWRHLWKEALLTLVPDATMEDAMNALSSFLDDFTTLHRPQNVWGFRFEFGHGIVLLATFSPNESLQLEFSARKQEVPRAFDWLLKPYWPLYSFKYWRVMKQYSSLKKIKSLHLISVNYAFNNAVSSMVSHLPFLESLTIRKCYGLRSLQIKDTKRLKKLVVLDCPLLESLSLEGSILKSFGYRGRLVSFDKFEVSCNDEHPRWRMNLYADNLLNNNFNHDGFKLILESVRNVKSLTLCGWVFEALIIRMLPSLSKDSEFRLYWLRELWWIDCSMDKENVNALLSFLKLCPYLERLCVTIDPKTKSYNMTNAKKRFGKVNLDYLKFLKLEGFANEKKEIFFCKPVETFIQDETVDCN